MSYTGQPLKRVEDPRLITGRGSFVDDIHLPDMLYAAVLRSPHAHARIKAIDVSAARHSPGVVTVLTGEDIAGVLLSTPWVPFLASHRIAGPYRTPAMRVEVLGVFTNKPPTGAYRGAGGPEAAFCMERTIDLIAKDLELDPAEVRRKNFISPDAFPYTTPTGVTYAVMDALSSVGVRHIDTPLTAEKIWRALHGRIGV